MTVVRHANIKMLINGQMVVGRNPGFTVIDPASNTAITTDCPHASAQQVDEAVNAAQTAFQLWSFFTLDQRKTVMLKVAQALEPHTEELAQLLSLEQGKPLANARSEVESGISAFKDCAKIEIPIEQIGETDTHLLQIHHKPIGVVAAIIPWNYPVYIALVKIMHALIYGNTVVIKPSPYTPLSTLKIAELIADVVPAGAVNVITGPDTRDEKCVGDELVRHPLVKLVAFTGSIATGKRVFSNSAPKMGRMILELGGNDPAIVLKDADVQKAALGVFEGSVINNGQICCGIKRIYVHKSIVDPFVTHLAQLARARVEQVGTGTSPDVTLGPLNNKMQFDRVTELVADAVAQGATVVAGGKKPAHVDQRGFFYEPTVLTNVKEGVRIVDEEQFGPVLPVMSFESEEEVILRANGTKYGLGASVWGTDAEAVNRVALRLEAGTVWTNEHAADAPGLAFGGFKESGIGREGANFDLLTYTECQSVKLLKQL